MQQGDPLGPLLFSLSIHKLCAKLKSELAVFYLDDGTLGGNWEEVLSDLRLIEEEASELGLELNRSKTELICSDHTARGIVLSSFPGLRVANIEQVELLGSPLGDASSVNACVSGKIELLGDRLYHLHSHDVITLLCHSFAISKMLHVLRTSPCFSSPRLDDVLLYSILSNITNIRFEDNQSSWIQATLPVSKGGLGIKSAIHLASSAFLASADGSVAPVHQILPLRLNNTPYQEKVEARRQWGVGLDVPPPTPPVSFRQKEWDAPRAGKGCLTALHSQ